MTWFKVDDSLFAHPKVIRAGYAAMGLWVLAGAWAAQRLADGFVPDDMVDWLVPDVGHTLADQLVAAGLWEPAKTSGVTGYQFHDWATYQPAAAEVRAERQQRATARAEASLAANHQRWHVKPGRRDPGCARCAAGTEAPSGPPSDSESVRIPDGLRTDSNLIPPARPVPARPTDALRASEGGVGGTAASSRPPTAGTARSPSHSDGPTPRERGTRLPADFTVTDAMRRWAADAAPGVDLDRATAMFRDHWAAAAGAQAAKRDWPAAWRNWVRREPDRGPARGNGRGDPVLAERHAILADSMRRAQARDAAAEQGGAP